MRPAQIRFVAEMPLTLFGKVDRQALEQVAASDTGRAAVPRTPMEKTVFDVWAGALETTQFGIDDDFFSRRGRLYPGGHRRQSIAAPVGEANSGEPASCSIAPSPPLRRNWRARPTLSIRCSRRTSRVRFAADACPGGIWLLLRLEPTLHRRITSRILRLARSCCGCDSLSRRWGSCTERHEVFRDAHCDDAGEPKQYVESGSRAGPVGVDSAASLRRLHRIESVGRASSSLRNGGDGAMLHEQAHRNSASPTGAAID